MRRDAEMIVGITGGYCSGKSAASGVFRDLGYEVVDVDRVGHEALEAKRDEVVSAFGAGILNRCETGPRESASPGGPRSGKGAVDRGKLGAVVFADPSEREKLEAIVHPWMIRRVREMIRGKRKVVIDAALLIEMCLFALCDRVLAIETGEEFAVARGMARGGLTREQALLRIRSQIPLKRKIQFVDKVIENNGDIGAFEKKVREYAGSVGEKV
jgi:dephospho-CoA kinase